MKEPANTVLTGSKARATNPIRDDYPGIKHRLFYINKKPPIAQGHYSFKELNELTHIHQYNRDSLRESIQNRIYLGDSLKESKRDPGY